MQVFSVTGTGMKMIRAIRKRRWTCLFIALIVPLGFLTKFYSGPASSWVNNSLGGILYVIFWSLLFSVLFTRTGPWKVALMVTGATFVLEFLQLWHPVFLENIRSTFLGAAFLGNTFVITDLFYYLVGLVVSGLLIGFLRKRDSGNT